jgi:hypothetical protein
VTLDVYDNSETSEPLESRPFVGVLFDCCGVYARIYRHPDARVYQGRCPKCLRMLTLRVGPDGTAARIFRAE